MITNSRYSTLFVFEFVQYYFSHTPLVHEIKTARKFVCAKNKSHFIAQIQVRPRTAEKLIKNRRRGYEGQELRYGTSLKVRMQLQLHVFRFSSFLSALVSPKCANLKLSEYVTFWVREFKMCKFKAERKSVLRKFSSVLTLNLSSLQYIEIVG